MSVQRRPATALCFALIALLSVPTGAAAQAAKRDAIADWLKAREANTPSPIDPAVKGNALSPAAAAAKAAAQDPRDGDPQYEQAKAFPLAYLRKFGFITASARDHAATVRQLLSLLGVASIEAFWATWSQGSVAYRRAAVGRKDTLALARMPAEYRAISSSPAATRADVAALLGVRLEALLARTTTRQAVVTDLRGHWAERWILAAVRAGVMDTQPNYTFQPGPRVRRGDLAQTVSRVLGVIAANKPEQGKTWLSARAKIADVAPTHLNYPAVSQVVAAGVMSLDEKGAFILRRAVEDVADAMGVSRITVYNYLNAIHR